MNKLTDIFPAMKGNVLYIYLFVLCSMLRSLSAQFVKAKQMVKLYALSGVLGTATTLLFDILFLVVFKWGVTGYIMAMICSDFLSLLFLFISARLHRYIRLSYLKRDAVSNMLRYALPMIPTNAFWWITDLSDRYILTYFKGEGANGLYAVSYKIPTIMILLVGIFMDAWQISILTETSRLARQKFFARVFSMYQSVVFVSASGLIVFAKVITKILVSSGFYESWQYIPMLILATCFSCFVTFFGTIYVVEKKSISTLVTTILGAVLNIIGNFLLIPKMGAQGAALSTCHQLCGGFPYPGGAYPLANPLPVECGPFWLEFSDCIPAKLDPGGGNALVDSVGSPAAVGGAGCQFQDPAAQRQTRPIPWITNPPSF